MERGGGAGGGPEGGFSRDSLPVFSSGSRSEQFRHGLELQLKEPVNSVSVPVTEAWRDELKRFAEALGDTNLTKDPAKDSLPKVRRKEIGWLLGYRHRVFIRQVCFGFLTFFPLLNVRCYPEAWGGGVACW